MFILLVLENPLGSNNVMILSGRPLHKRPDLIPGETCELILHSNEPIHIFNGLFDPKWFNTRHKREVSAKVHKLTTSNNTLPQSREHFVNLNPSCHQGHGGRWSFKRFKPFRFIYHICFIIKSGTINKFIIFSKVNAVTVIFLRFLRIINLWCCNHIGLRRVLFLFLDDWLIMSNWILMSRRCLWWWTIWSITNFIISRHLSNGYKISNAHDQNVLRGIFIITYIT